MRRILRSPDFIAVLALVILWLIFFWRLFTPTFEDQVSLSSGDFSGQFIAFGAYQYERLAAGEVPLWNPYNNGGLPFIADTQAAVFYPPRLMTIAVSNLTGGWRYNSLQMEMVTHILLYTLLMYGFVRRLTRQQGQVSVFAGFIAAIIAGYSGFMSGYPPVQLALLEAGVWLPLGLLGILEATRHDKPRYIWIVLAGVALGISWMAGHPQTSWFATYLMVAYLAFRIFARKIAVRHFFIALVLMGAITGGIAAVQLLPGFEYLSRTMRTALNFDAKGGGFPIQDVIQFVLPGAVSLYSPLFVGVSGLILAVIGWTGKQDQYNERLFWLGVAVVSLTLSLGANGALYHALYNVAPGLQFFRGQERAAYLVMNSLAISAGLGITALATVSIERWQKQIRYGVLLFAGTVILVAAGIALLWLGNRDSYGEYISPAVLSGIIAGTVALLTFTRPRRPYLPLICIALVFELFTVNIGGINYEPIPASAQPIMQTPPLVERVLAEATQPYRVDGGVVRGQIGVYGHGNTGSLYQIPDIRGISPLFLDGPHAIIQRQLPSEVAWELFAVDYVFSDAEELVVPSEIIARDYPDGQVLNLHKLTDPRPFLLPVTDYVIAESDAEAWALLANAEFDERNTLILADEPNIDLSNKEPADISVTFGKFQPETFDFQVQTDQNTLLSIAQVDYPGWKVKIDGDTAGTIRAYGGLVALPIEAGSHHIEFTYDPLTYRLGAILSLLTWAGVSILAVIWITRIIKHADTLAHDR